MQDAAAGEMPPEIDKPHAFPKLFLLPVPKFDMRAFVEYPLLIAAMDVYGTAKCICPVIHIAVIMGMGKSYGAETSVLPYECFDGVIQQRDTIPEDITFA